MILGHPVDWNADEVVITGFIPVEIEYRFGPTFRPSEADVHTFRKIAADENGNVIGYYRSQLRHGITVREEDRQLLTELFQETDCCFACAPADSQTPTTIDLHKVRGGAAPALFESFRLKEHEPSPVVAALLAAQEAREPIAVREAEIPPLQTQVALTQVALTPVAVETPEPPPPLVPEMSVAEKPDALTAGIDDTQCQIFPDLIDVRAPSPEPDARPAIFGAWNSKRMRWVIASVITVLLVLAVVYTSQNRSVLKPNPRPVSAAETLVARRVDSRIGLGIVERAPQIEIRWDAASPFVRASVRGRLVVRDVSESLVDLDSAQLLSGSYSYRPVKDSLTLVMTVYQADGSFTDETIKFTREFRPPPISSAQQPSSHSPAIPAKQPAKKPPPSSNPPQPVVPTLTNARVDAQPTPILTETPQPLSGEQAVMPPEPARAPATVDPPAINAAAVPAVQPATTPSPTPEQGAAANNYVWPKVVHMAVPAIPPGIAPSIRGAAQVEVRVAIDATGKVSGARVVSSTGPGASLLTIEALRAAQLCRFTAAQENGHPVPSSMVLRFRFAEKSK